MSRRENGNAGFGLSRIWSHVCEWSAWLWPFNARTRTSANGALVFNERNLSIVLPIGAIVAIRLVQLNANVNANAINVGGTMRSIVASHIFTVGASEPLTNTNGANNASFHDPTRHVPIPFSIPYTAWRPEMTYVIDADIRRPDGSVLFVTSSAPEHQFTNVRMCSVYSPEEFLEASIILDETRQRRANVNVANDADADADADGNSNSIDVELFLDSQLVASTCIPRPTFPLRIQFPYAHALVNITDPTSAITRLAACWHQDNGRVLGHVDICGLLSKWTDTTCVVQLK